MRSNIFLKSILFVSTICATIAIASPIDSRNNNDDAFQAVARSMMGSANNLVSWDSMQLERSPADPENVEVLEKRIVYNPPITSPNKNTVWHAGQQETVRWTVDQSKIPADAKNFKVTIKLGYIHKDGRGGENLRWTLAKDVAITDEEAEITVPTNLTAHDNFIVVVMGDSGNASPQFSIKTTDAKTNQAVKCSAGSDDTTEKNAVQKTSQDNHPTVKNTTSQPVNAREVGETDTFAVNMLGRDVQMASS